MYVARVPCRQKRRESSIVDCPSRRRRFRRPKHRPPFLRRSGRVRELIPHSAPLPAGLPVPQIDWRLRFKSLDMDGHRQRRDLVSHGEHDGHGIGKNEVVAAPVQRSVAPVQANRNLCRGPHDAHVDVRDTLHPLPQRSQLDARGRHAKPGRVRRVVEHGLVAGRNRGELRARGVPDGLILRAEALDERDQRPGVSQVMRSIRIRAG